MTLYSVLRRTQPCQLAAATNQGRSTRSSSGWLRGPSGPYDHRTGTGCFTAIAQVPRAGIVSPHVTFNIIYQHGSTRSRSCACSYYSQNTFLCQYGADKNVHCRSGLWSGRPSPQPGFKPEALTGCFSNHLTGIHAETSAVQSLLGSVMYGDLGWQVI